MHCILVNFNEFIINFSLILNPIQASSNGHKEIVDLLLKNNAFINFRTNEELTPLYIGFYKLILFYTKFALI
jgi:ankyrin repeat protein